MHSHNGEHHFWVSLSEGEAHLLPLQILCKENWEGYTTVVVRSTLNTNTWTVYQKTDISKASRVSKLFTVRRHYLQQWSLCSKARNSTLRQVQTFKLALVNSLCLSQQSRNIHFSSLDSTTHCTDRGIHIMSVHVQMHSLSEK